MPGYFGTTINLETWILVMECSEPTLGLFCRVCVKVDRGNTFGGGGQIGCSDVILKRDRTALQLNHAVVGYHQQVDGQTQLPDLILQFTHDLIQSLYCVPRLG